MTAIERDIQKVQERIHEVAIERTALYERIQELDASYRALAGRLAVLRARQELHSKVKRGFFGSDLAESAPKG